MYFLKADINIHIHVYILQNIHRILALSLHRNTLIYFTAVCFFFPSTNAFRDMHVDLLLSSFTNEMKVSRRRQARGGRLTTPEGRERLPWRGKALTEGKSICIMDA